MASTSKSEIAVLERRLRPIYDCIDIGNNKKAIQEADKVIKKHGPTHCAKVLKALAMIRMDRMHEAWAVLNEAESSINGIALDDNTLQAFTHCYKEVAAPERIARLYEKQCALQPNESFLAHLFMAYVRCRNYKQQQQVAMRLYKETNNPPYYFWAVMSIVMQAIENPVMGSKMFYPLAEKMILKQVDIGGYKQGPEVELMALVKEGLGKQSEAVDILTGDITTKLIIMPRHFLAARCMRLLQQAGQLERAWARALNLMSMNVDDWTILSILFDTTIERMKECEGEKQKSIVSEVVRKMRMEFERSPGHRGVYLARFELNKRLTEAGFDSYIDHLDLNGSSLVELMFGYVKEFYMKPCCFADLRPYLWLMNEDELKAFDNSLEKFAVDTYKNQGLKAPDNESWALLTVERLRRAIGLQSLSQSKDEARAHVTKLTKAMVRAEDSDLAAAAFAQVASAILWDMFVKENDHRALYEMILLLEMVAAKHKSDPLSKIVLCKAYSYLGCAQRVQSLLKLLDVKAVQRDSLGYIVHPLPELCGRYKIAIIHYTELGAMFDQSEREISECVISAYKNGSFGQIPDLIRLGDRMRNSMLAVGSDVMSRWMSSLFAVENIEEIVNTLHGDEEEIDWSSLVDNRDLNVIPILQPGKDAQKKVDHVKEYTHKEMVDSFHLRHELMKSAASIGKSSCSVTILKERLQKLEDVVKHLKQFYAKDSKESILVQAPTSVNLSSFVHDGNVDMMLTVLRGAVNYVEKNDERVLPEKVSFQKCLDVCLPSSSTLSTSFSAHPVVFAASRALQSLAFCKIVLEALQYRVGEENTISGISSGKKKQNKEKSSFSSAIDALICLLVSTSRSIEQSLNTVKSALQADALLPQIGDDWPEDVEIVLKTEKPTVDAGIYKNYGAAVDDMKTTIDNVFKKRGLLGE